ncbi:major facilitator superfamily transporter [Aspergillus pseudoustus]|uniref:Major facilitator superfamily transporter n=1 Tax=Aspergillus pseudoustus TaxID=1810923 RepID=A0ABR4KEH1_9EURO
MGETHASEDSYLGAECSPAETHAPPSQETSNAINHSPAVQYPPTWRLICLALALYLALFCACLDQTVLATATPRITSEFHSADHIGWYGSSYLISMCAVKMVWGKLYTLFPPKWVFMTGVAVFEVGSLVCGLAPSSVALILGRAIAGLGASSIDSGIVIIFLLSVPLAKQPLFITSMGSIRGITAAVGPPLGGTLTDNASWRWCFYINLPCGAITMIVVFLLLSPGQFDTSSPEPDARRTNPYWKQTLQSIDLLGTLLLVSGTVSLLLWLQLGGATYSWSNWRIILLITLSAVLLLLFLAVQHKLQDKALLPLRLFHNRNVLGGSWFVSCTTGALFVFIYYLPIWLQEIQQLSPTTSGLSLLATELGMVTFSLLGGALVTLLGYYTPFLIASSVISAIGAGMLSTLQPGSSMAAWIGYQVLFSAGVGLGAQNAFLIAQVAVAQSEKIDAVNVMGFAQTLSGAVVLAVSNSLFQGRLGANFEGLGLGVPDIGVVLKGTSVVWEVIPQGLDEAVLGAYNRGIRETFYFGVALSAVSLIGSVVLEWKSIRKHEDFGKGAESETKT